MKKGMVLRLLFVGDFVVDLVVVQEAMRVEYFLERAFVHWSPFRGWSEPSPLVVPFPLKCWLRIESGSVFVSKGSGS
jgi:hypothetical protein